MINNRNTISDIGKSAVGKLMCVCGQTRPDISFEVCQLAANIKIHMNRLWKMLTLFSNLKQSECNLIKIFAISNKGKNKTVYVYFVKQKLFGYSPSSVQLNSTDDDQHLLNGTV